MLKEKLTAEQINKLPSARTTQMADIPVMTMGEPGAQLALSRIVEFMGTCQDPNVSIAITTTTITLIWMDSVISSLAIDLEKGFMLLYGDSAPTEIGNLIHDLCHILLADKVFFNKHDGE